MLSLSCQKRTTTIFAKGKHYTYSAVYIQSNGDTLTNEVIELIPKSRPWSWQWSQRTVKIVYRPDTTNLLDWKNPISWRLKFYEDLKKEWELKGKKWTGVWQINKRTGVIENEKYIWMHPFRSNQYIYTEIAPFPLVGFSKLRSGETYSNWIQIGNPITETERGWGEFSGRIEKTYTVVDTTSFEIENKKIDSCWIIHSVGNHSSLGENCNDFIFSKEYGFVQMDYSFYDGVQIQFKMIGTRKE